MARFKTKLNDLDITNLIQRYGIGFSYEKRLGSNSGFMLDGSETVDVLAWKLTLVIPLNPMTAAEQAAVLTVAMTDYLTVYHYDPKTANYATSAFIPEIGQASATILRNDGAIWFEGLALTLREK